MKNKNYIVNRSDIYVGDVCGINPKQIEVYPNGIFDYDLIDCGILTVEQLLTGAFEGRPYLYNRGEQLDYNFGSDNQLKDILFKRSMLFVLDENNHANDLLYDSPHYPILNISPNKDCLDSSICILHNTYQLNKVLQFFGYPEQLRYDDILKIRQTLFNCDFVFENCELFGRVETGQHESCFEFYDSKGTHRTFNEDKLNSPLSDRYFFGIVANNDYFSKYEQNESTGEFITVPGHIVDSFEPRKLEGKIRSLHL